MQRCKKRKAARKTRRPARSHGRRLLPSSGAETTLRHGQVFWLSDRPTDRAFSSPTAKMASCGVRPRLQRRDRGGFAPPSLSTPTREFRAEHYSLVKAAWRLLRAMLLPCNEAAVRSSRPNYALRNVTARNDACNKELRKKTGPRRLPSARPLLLLKAATRWAKPSKNPRPLSQRFRVFDGPPPASCPARHPSPQPWVI